MAHNTDDDLARLREAATAGTLRAYPDAMHRLIADLQEARVKVVAVRTLLDTLAADLAKAEPQHFSIGLMRGRVKQLRGAARD